MKEKTREAIIELSLAIKQDDRYVTLLIEEKNLENNPDIRALSQKVKIKADEYEEANKLFGPEDPVTINKRKELHYLKKELDENPVSLRYMEALKTYNEMSSNIGRILNEGFNMGGCKR